MGQQEVLNTLGKFNKPVSRGEIAKELEEQPCKISKILLKLLIQKEIKCIEINKDQANKLYHCRRRIRLYYI